jgi:hypothetical protein
MWPALVKCAFQPVSGWKLLSERHGPQQLEAGQGVILRV